MFGIDTFNGKILWTTKYNIMQKNPYLKLVDIV